MIALGVVGAFFAYRGAESAATTGEFSAALSGQLVDVAPDLTFMWVFIVVAALGVVALIVRAATTR